MNKRIRYLVRREIRALFELKKTERLWHFPVLASLCVGIPLLIGLFFGKLNYAILSCTGGLVILYLPAAAPGKRMVTMLGCSLGFMLSLAIGLLFSFNAFVSSLMLGILAFGVHWITRYFNLKSPGNFFFIMLVSMGSCMPYQLSIIPQKVVLIGMGTLLACVLAFCYGQLLKQKKLTKKEVAPVPQRRYSSVIDSAIIGLVVGLSLLVAHLLQLSNPYWVPISCIAVMQGISTRHVWQRSLQRILGTYIGLGITWVILSFHLTPLSVCISILVLQFVVEMLIVRHYGLAVIFVTPLTLLLAEAGRAMSVNPATLVSARFIDIVLGSLIGALGGWVLYHRQLHAKAERQIRKVRIAVLRR
ncbi:MAG: FUSC family protein [Bacteroidota bacterium]